MVTRKQKDMDIYIVMIIKLRHKSMNFRVDLKDKNHCFDVCNDGR